MAKGRATSVLIRKRRRHEQQPVRLRKRQRLEQHRIHDAEDRGIGADTQRQSDHGDHGKRRVTCAVSAGHSERLEER